MKKHLISLSVAVLAWAGALAAQAQGTDFIAILSGDDEVPANASRARGIAHIHTGVAGMNGPVVQGLFSGSPGGGRFSGILAKGSFAATEELLAAMENGGTYVNVHTNDGIAPPNTGPGDLPGGEIRGQVVTLADDEEE